MAAPLYTWEFNCDLFGDRVPKIVTLEATAIEVAVGTALCMDGSGRVALATDGNGALFIGLSAEATTGAAKTAGDPIRVEIIASGMVIKGTSLADASALSGFISKVYDFNAAGDLDGADVTGGGLSIFRTEDAGLTVYCLCTKGAIIA
jgi:hypothetical protein